jgi:Raf kinase inhibitor-like YbhB/YbcL family protein
MPARIGSIGFHAVAALVVVATAGCTSSTREPADTGSADSPTEPVGGIAMTIDVKSLAFGHGQPIPKKHTGDGDDISPELSWSNVPEGTQELALICDDPDAPRPEPWVHWIIYRIPAHGTGLPEGIATQANLSSPAGARQGSNSWDSGQTIGYRGPAPPSGHGVHHYHFKLYALDTPLDLPSGADKQSLLKAMEGHILGRGELVGTYQR